MEEKIMSTTIQESLKINIQKINNRIQNKNNLNVRKVRGESNWFKEINLIFLDGITNTENIQEYILKPLQSADNIIYESDSLIEDIAEKVIKTASVKITSTYEDITEAILNGNTVLLVEGTQALIML